MEAGKSQERSIDFERWWNVRDLGGLPLETGGTTRRGLVLRATSPQYATPTDVAKARELDLVSLVDLRTPSDPPPWFSEVPEARRRSVNVVGAVRSRRQAPSEVLTVIADEGRREVAEAIRAVLEFTADGRPAVVHCHTGKDRTGLLVIVLLLLAGVPRDEIVDDYLSSNPGFEAMRATLDPSGDSLFSPQAPAAVRGPVTRESADAALRFLDEQGGVRSYLASAGLTTEEIDRAARLLLPPGD